MSSTVIRCVRTAQGLTIYDLAERLGVTAGAVSQLERSEAAGTIKLNTLRSALAAMDRDLKISVEVYGPECEPERILERREERISWELHRTLAQKLLADPEPMLLSAHRNIERMRTKVHGTLVHAWLDDWQRVTSTSLSETVQIMLSTSEYAVEMRQNSPFSGLSLEERVAAIEHAKLDDGGAPPLPGSAASF